MEINYSEVMNGCYKIYDNDGNLSSEISYKNDMICGIYKRLFSEDKLIWYVDVYKNELANGVTIVFGY